MKYFSLYFLFVLSVLIPVSTLRAQDAGQIPDASRLGADRVEERLPEELLKPFQPSFKDIPLIEGIPEQGMVTPDKSGVTFKVDNIIVQGNTVFDNAVLHEQITNAIGEHVSLTDLRQAALNITDLYRQEGYAFSSAYIPQQTLENSTVIIQIIEGYIGEVEYRGIEVGEHSTIHAYAKSLMTHRPVKTEDLERYVLLINDLQGIQAKAIMSLVKDVPGAVKLILLMDEHHHQAGMITNNRGSEALGPWQSNLYYKYNNLLGANDQTTLLYLATPGSKQLRFFSVGQDIPVGGEGTRFFYAFRRSESQPGAEAKTFNITSQSNSVTVGISHPWIRERRQNLSTSLSFDVRNSGTQSFDSEIINDHLRHLRGEVNYNRVHGGGVSSVNTTLSQGLKIMHATPDNDLQMSRLGATSDAAKIQGEIRRIQPLSDDFTLTVKGNGQWAFQPVLSAELFGIGGSEYGRAFDFSALTGDNGYAASAEINYKVPLESEAVSALNVYSFIDGGRAYDDINLIGDNWQGLSTYGGGVDVLAYKLLNARMELAKPITISTEDKDYNLKAYGSVGVKMDF